MFIRVYNKIRIEFSFASLELLSLSSYSTTQLLYVVLY